MGTASARSAARVNQPSQYPEEPGDSLFLGHEHRPEMLGAFFGGALIRAKLAEIERLLK
jgi:hypothetical protein